MVIVYDNIKRRRLELGMTQSELAAKVGYTDRSSISRVEKGEIALTLEMLEKFAEALQISAFDLYDDKADELLVAFEELNAEGKQRLIEFAAMLKNGGYSA